MIGDVVHKLFEGISKGIILEQDIKIKAEKLFASKGIAAKEKERLFSIIEKDISLLKEKGIWQDIIMPKENSFAELPFILDSGEFIYAGRVDRVIRDNDTYKIYDYKTFL
jgi:ATP-dependent exoDNAse (exonuclease V) beta subunit